MKIKETKYSSMIAAFVLFIIIFISIITWFYPYSTLSVSKSYTFQPNKVLINGKSYNEILSDFKEAYEKDYNDDLENTYPNLTILRTQYVIPVFEQDWLISKDSVSIDIKKLDTMLSDVKGVREVLLNLVAQAEYNSEQRYYLINIIRNFLLMEESITELKNDSYVTRSELKRRFSNLYNEFITVSRLFISFYDM